ncbi:hypothetical protein JW835_14925 [bacterium]|nr:hypothetical protein [bacterium]
MAGQWREFVQQSVLSLYHDNRDRDLSSLIFSDFQNMDIGGSAFFEIPDGRTNKPENHADEHHFCVCIPGDITKEM